MAKGLLSEAIRCVGDLRAVHIIQEGLGLFLQMKFPMEVPTCAEPCGPVSGQFHPRESWALLKDCKEPQPCVMESRVMFGNHVYWVVQRERLVLTEL